MTTILGIEVPDNWPPTDNAEILRLRRELDRSITRRCELSDKIRALAPLVAFETEPECLDEILAGVRRALCGGVA